MGSTDLVPIDTVLDIISEGKTIETEGKREAMTSFRKARSNYMTRM